MALDRWIALIILGVCLAYGYTAWFVMDEALAPFMRRAPIWPSSFPKILAIFGIMTSLRILLARGPAEIKELDIDYRRLGDYHLGQAIALLALMVAYALLLRPLGFLGSTFGFLVLGSALLGERRWGMMALVAALATFIVWYLVQQVLGIYLRPLPGFFGG